MQDARKVDDVVRSLGYLTLGTRLKRIGERLQGDTQVLLRKFEAGLPSGQFPVLAALDRLGPLSIGELAQALGIAQPGVTRLVGRMQSEGIVITDPSAHDRRVRKVALSAAGRHLVDSTKHSAWPAVEKAVADACTDLSGPLLHQLAGLEDALAAAPLDRRPIPSKRTTDAARALENPIEGSLESPLEGPLDNPVWASLATYHAELAQGDARTLRFRRDVNMFAATRGQDATSLKALAESVRPGETVYVLRAGPIVVPPGLKEIKCARGVQMVATKAMPMGNDSLPIEVLSDDDAPEMLALANLTEPGPFFPKTHKLGRFIGVRIDGRLAAMAGERMRLPGYTEVSGVCTHPDFRGRGLARALSAAAAAHIAERYETPFLHAWRDNTAAIALYESLGFRLRTEINVSVLMRP